MTKKAYHIWQKQNDKGEWYWGVGNFCGLAKSLVQATGADLTELEWEGNEYYITQEQDLWACANAVVIHWKKQMETEFPETTFAILCTWDTGDTDVTPSVTLRFWAIRNGYTIITKEQIANQPHTWLVLVNEKNKKV